MPLLKFQPSYVVTLSKVNRLDQCESVKAKLLCYKEQGTQCRYNVTLRGVCATIVTVGKQWVLHNLSVCICNLKYPACNAHAPYCHLWPVPLCNIFFHIISLTARFSKKCYWIQNVCFDFLYNFCLIHFSFYEEMSEIW